jgi:hypothetical protein
VGGAASTLKRERIRIDFLSRNCYEKYYNHSVQAPSTGQAEEIVMNAGFNGMQGKKIFFIAVLTAVLGIAFGSILVTAASTYAAEEQEFPDEIFINNQVYKPDRKGPVYFSHAEHAEGYVDACDACHHDYKDGKNVWQEGQPVQKCAACHDPQKREGKVRKLNIAYHKNCKGCHRELAGEGGTQAPYRQCTDCHAKR